MDDKSDTPVEQEGERETERGRRREGKCEQRPYKGAETGRVFR